MSVAGSAAGAGIALRAPCSSSLRAAAGSRRPAVPEIRSPGLRTRSRDPRCSFLEIARRFGLVGRTGAAPTRPGIRACCSSWRRPSHTASRSRPGRWASRCGGGQRTAPCICHPRKPFPPGRRRLAPLPPRSSRLIFLPRSRRAAPLARCAPPSRSARARAGAARRIGPGASAPRNWPVLGLRACPSELSTPLEAELLPLMPAPKISAAARTLAFEPVCMANAPIRIART